MAALSRYQDEAKKRTVVETQIREELKDSKK